MRQRLVFLHRYVGLAIAGFLAFAGLTGSIIAFQPELDAWLNPQLLRVEVGRAAMPISDLVASVEAADRRISVSTIAFSPDLRDARVLWITPHRNPKTGLPYELGFNQILADPSTGKVLGQRDFGALRFDRAHLIPLIYELHYTLHLPRPWGLRLGYWVMGAVAIAWIIDCFVGFCLTLPRGRPFWNKWRLSWNVKRNRGVYRLNLDLHRSFGLWLWPVLFVIAFSGIYLNMSREVFLPVVRLFGPVTPEPSQHLSVLPPEATENNIGWDAAIETARSKIPLSNRTRALRWVTYIPEQAAYIIDMGEPERTGRGLRYEKIALDARNGEILAEKSYDNGTNADRLIAWQYPLHSGQIGGLPGRIIICISGIVVTMLSITGIYLWWKKRAPRVARKSADRARRRAASPSPNPSPPDR